VRITSLSTVVVNAEMRNWVFVKVETDEGLTGWGEATVEWKTRAVAACVEDLATLLLGEDPRRVEHLFQIMLRQHFFRPGMVESSAISGIEQACWDILGKSLEVPVWQLLGGHVRDHVRLYDHLGGGEMHSVYHALSAEQAREKAHESLAAGFDAIKLEVVIPRTAPLDGAAALRHADQVMAAVREAVGDDVELMVDMHGRSSPQMAVQYFRVLEPYRPWFFEEACPADQPRAMAELARRTWVPLAAGERLTLRKPFHELLELGAANGVAKLPTKPGLGVEVDEREAAKHPFQQEPLMRYFHPDGAVADW
jgi:galactonate dehydratase